jgi:hypothetical protein
MRRLDRYDIIGLVIATFIAALWISHLVLPAAPPDTVTRSSAVRPSTARADARSAQDEEILSMALIQRPR